MKDGYVSEIFSSIQGEGLEVGERQVFFRLAGCNLQCVYCDTPGRDLAAEGKREKNPGQRDFVMFKNPLPAEAALEFMKHFFAVKNLHHSLAITGGEPLLQSQFLAEILPAIKKMGIKIFLETNGTLPDNLAEILDYIDIVSIDYKLPSAGVSGSYQLVHLKCLEMTLMKDSFAKIVFTRETRVTEIDAAAKAIASVDREIPLVLQPVTPYGPVKFRPGYEECLSFQAVAKRHLASVRVLPQIHKILGLL